MHSEILPQNTRNEAVADQIANLLFVQYKKLIESQTNAPKGTSGDANLSEQLSVTPTEHPPYEEEHREN